VVCLHLENGADGGVPGALGFSNSWGFLTNKAVSLLLENGADGGVPGALGFSNSWGFLTNKAVSLLLENGDFKQGGGVFTF